MSKISSGGSGPTLRSFLLLIRVTRRVQSALAVANFSLIAQPGFHGHCLAYIAYATARLLYMLLRV